jgi:hypothetical protein
VGKPFAAPTLAVHPMLLTNPEDDSCVDMVNKTLQTWNSRSFDDAVAAAKHKYAVSSATPAVLAVGGAAYRRRYATTASFIRPFVPALLSLPAAAAGSAYYGTFYKRGDYMAQRYNQRRIAWNGLRTRWEAYRPGDLYRPQLAVEMMREVDADKAMFAELDQVLDQEK